MQKSLEDDPKPLCLVTSITIVIAQQLCIIAQRFFLSGGNVRYPTKKEKKSGHSIRIFLVHVFSQNVASSLLKSFTSLSLVYVLQK